ncbi:GH36-type glycosyl hydrolase domain-containing protein [Variovorax sp. RB2P76]|uniref:GH36-type glycosyl hydrolase domain-containing protein n=1 Tax=Variovorax sp. RB2P76 TaxID=3443736 RepID=UPI003F4510C0
MSAAAAVDRLQGLSSYARALLLGPHDPVAPPIRAELFGIQRFEQHGHSLARAQVVEKDDTHHAREGAPFFPRVDENLESLRNAFDYIALISLSGRYVSPAAEWLLDNFHLVEAQLQQIHDGVPRSYYARLPKLVAPPLAGLPRVYGIAWAYVAHTDSVLNKTLFTAFLNAYQDVDELTLGELWALPTTLRAVLLENLRRVAESIAENKVAREIAHAAWDAAPHLSSQDLDVLYRALQSHGLQGSYLTQLWQRLPVEHGDNMPALVRWTEQHCPNGPALIGDAQNAQAAANLTVGNIITTLRMIGQVEWSDLIEPVSRSLRVLRELPSFANESELTRQQITHAMEQVARTGERPEREVAQAVVQLASGAPADEAGAETDRPDGTAGYYLFGQGRTALVAALQARQSAGRAAGRTVRAPPVRQVRSHRGWRLPVYIGSVALGTALLLAAVVHGLPHRGDWTTVLAMALLAWPVSEALLSLAQRIMAESVRVQALPRLDFANGIPERHRALVVMPTLLASVANNAQLVHRLELHWLANREDHAQFALLTDWADAAQASLPADGPLLDDALQRIAALNAKYPVAPGAAPRFLLLHRPRSWSDTEQRWMGWERKRGKLEMLVRLLASGDGSGFLPLADGLRLAAGRTPYVLTLDSDTGLPPGVLRDLVAIAAHPLNAPEIDMQSRRVVAGFGILQPRIVTPFPMQDERSFFHWVFAGQCGLDPYGSGASDIYQDVFGSGSFTGKGLLNVRALHATLDRRLPDGAVLSHDLLEGTVARCAMVSDVVLVEDHPHHAGVSASRVHRWVRGDWQLLPLMWRARRFGLDALGLWKMADNLRRSLVAPASLALLVLVIFTQAMPLGWALAAVASALTLGPMLGALAGLVPTRRAIELRHFFDVGAVELLRAMAGAAWQFVQLAAQSRLLLDAWFRATWRLVVSRRHLLEWTTAAQAQAQSSQRLLPFLRNAAASSVLCLALAVAAHWSAYPVIGALLFVLWALAPVAAWWSSRVEAKPPEPLSTAQRTYLETVAHDTWRFFEHVVGPDDNHLPPDNLQLEPQPTIAHRTSPTNIGMYLLATCCAREFGWIGTDALLARITASLDSVDRMQKHQGHLFNWYDTQTLKPLPPDYVSSVDSGNFAGHLVAVAQACRAFAAQGCEPHEAPALETLAQRCDALHDGMDFSGLYDPKRHLFHIGLRVEENVLDASYYDLLASESRLLSFLAIAKGDVPRRHWMALGRPFLLVGFEPSLKSWSGSMFEYVMPALVMSEPTNGLLQVANTAAIAEQQAFGRAQNLPWGVSESAYFAQDHSLAYQYSPFGVPRLALRRTPPTDRVVAPYASAMAAPFGPVAAVANLERLEALGARGEFGFHDAVDFTASRQIEGQEFTVVRNFMAHHQGMSLVALCNVLCADAPRRWFASAALVQAHETLLHERTPRQIIGSADPRTPPEPSQAELAPLFQPRTVDPMAAGFQPTHLLSNGRYTVALRANGAGVSRWHSFNVTRWRDDPLRDSYGTFFFVRDVRTEGEAQAFTSLTALPAPGADWRYRTRFLADQVQFDATGPGLQVRTTVLISPEDDTELRNITLHNSGEQTRTLELVSYLEPVLSNPKADEAHPAFANLFVESRWEPAWRALLLSRKPRLHGDAVVAAAHFLASADATVLSIDCMTDRRAFIGRNRTLANPALDAQPLTARGKQVNGLDPIACLRVRLSIAPGTTARLSFATAADNDIEALMPGIDRYMQPMHVERATRMAATLAQVRLRDLSIAPAQNLALQDLTTILTYTTPRVMSDRGLIDLRQIWRFGISGDKPIVLVHIHSMNGMGLINTLLRAQPWWGFGGVACDLVVLNSEPNSYLMPLQREIEVLRARVTQQTQNSFPRNDTAGFYLLRDQDVVPSEKAALSSLARAVFTADGRPLEVQVAALHEARNDAASVADEAATPRGIPSLPRGVPLLPHAAATPPNSAPEGDFDADTGEYRFEVGMDRRTPRPWINVIANAAFGFQVSEWGTGFTWAGNSRMHQVTPWSNDPVQDPAFEHYLLQDLASREMLPLTPAGGTTAGARHRVRHGQGYTVFEHQAGALALDTTFFADRDEAVKLVHVRVHNQGTGARRLRALAMAEWQLGDARGTRRTVRCWKPEDQPAVFGEQRESSAGFGGTTAFLLLAGLQGATTGATQWTCDRNEFFGGRGGLEVPDTLARRAGSGLDACAAIGGEFVVAAGDTASFTFMLGHADSTEAALDLAQRWRQRDVPAALAQVRGFWDELLGRLQVRTPDPLFDALVNRWLVYQTLACRLWSKAGFYQAGGAFGFRDQLQDAMAFALTDPARLRDQILVNAARQFPEGDVQHWWHMPGGAGVRTHFSDDLLWLPYAVAHYVEVTGDASLLDEMAGFIEGPAIPDGAEDAYYAPQRSGQMANVFEHGARAIDRSLKTGVHGLPLMGTGDWNDGMNRVGNEGRGESVWLAWFLCSVVAQFAPLAQARGEHERVARWTAARAGWIAALHDAGWDGEWFRRAFFDNGAPLGSSTNDECRIDLIAQAWSVLSGASDDAHTGPAMASVKKLLHDEPAGLLRLLTPPFANSTNNPGYIQAYPPGVRENGGQYSHGAVWALMAQALQGDHDAAWQSFEGLSPAHRARHPERGPVYELEPYVMAGDVYGAAPYVGRGGWSWYTGSAAWLHRAAVETLLGLAVKGRQLSLTPRVPAHWPGFEIALRLGARQLTLQWGNVEGAAAPTHHLAVGEWIDWQALPANAVLRVG